MTYTIKELKLREAVNAQTDSNIKTYDNLLVAASGITHSELEDLDGDDYQKLSEEYYIINGDLDFKIEGKKLMFSDGLTLNLKPIKKRDFDAFTEMDAATDQMCLFVSSYLTPTEGLDTPVKYLNGLNEFFRIQLDKFKPVSSK